MITRIEIFRVASNNDPYYVTEWWNDGILEGNQQCPTLLESLQDMVKCEKYVLRTAAKRIKQAKEIINKGQ